MIRIDIGRKEIKVQGHARAAPYGKDIVCSAVSALAQTLVEAIRQLTDDNIETELMEGNLLIRYEKPSPEFILLTNAFAIGVKEIESSYPYNVNVCISQEMRR